MKKSLLPALPALALCLACGAGEPAIPEPALDRENSEVTQLVSEDPRDRFEAHVFKQGSGVLPYRLLKPRAYDRNERYPLVLFLHGAGQRGDDNIQQIAQGIWGFSSDDVREQDPCFVVAPQCPSDAQWVDTPWSADSHTMPEDPAQPLRLAME